MGATSVLPSSINPVNFMTTVTNSRNTSPAAASVTPPPAQVSDNDADDTDPSTDEADIEGPPGAVEDNSSSMPRWVQPGDYRLRNAARDRNKG